MASRVVCSAGRARWEYNSIGQDPCQLYAQLQGRCNSTFLISQADPTEPPYETPNTSCGCNVVAYNLMAGCSWCQYSIPDQWWPSVSQWAVNCTAVQYNPHVLPATIFTSNMTVPSWAFNSPTGSTWSPSEASSIAAQSSSTSHGDDYSSEGSSMLGSIIFMAVISFGIPIIAGLLALCYIVSCCMLWQRQTRRRAFYSQRAAYYRTQRSGYSYTPYAPNANPEALGSSAPLIYPNQPQTPATEYAYLPSFSAVNTNVARGAQSAPIEMTDFHPEQFARGESARAVDTWATTSADPTPLSSPFIRGGFEEVGVSGNGAGGGGGMEAVKASPRRTKGELFDGHADGGYSTHRANEMDEEGSQSLPTYAEGFEEVRLGSKEKARAT